MASLIRLVFVACAIAACYARVPIKGLDLDTRIPGEYLISLKKGSIGLEARTLQHITLVRSYYIGNWRGAFVKVDDEFLDLLAEDSNVKSIDVNAMAHIACEEQEDLRPGLWGLQRLSHALPEENSHYKWDADIDDGTGVDVYVLDTGIRVTHNDYGGRATWGYSASGMPGEDEGDQNGHGTHCAGTVGGAIHGVAKNANLIAVQVLGHGGSGSWAGIIEGIEWVAAQHNQGGRKSVINMSLGGSRNQEVNDATTAAVEEGVHVAVAAGNSAADACNFSPAGTPEAVCVASSNVNDNLSTFSNHGDCVDIVAPGESILSTYNLSDDSTSTLSGTSMASPHVAGWIARYLVRNDDSPAVVMREIVDTGTHDALNIVPGRVVNVLPYRACDEDLEPPRH